MAPCNHAQPSSLPEGRNTAAVCAHKLKRGVLDDGYHPELVEGAEFDGVLGIPVVPAPKRIIVPTDLTPWTKVQRSSDPGDFGCFYEHDLVFREVITDLELQEDKLGRMRGWVTPDCSLYRNMPLALQVVLVYGAKPRYVFDGLESQAEFVRFPDWTTRMRGGQ